jgi:hypothetical protein
MTASYGGGVAEIMDGFTALADALDDFAALAITKPEVNIPIRTDFLLNR